MIRPFEGNLNSRYLQGIKLYLQEKKEIWKEGDKLDISVSNAKYILNHFLSISNKYLWGGLAFMVKTGAINKKILCQVYQIHISDMHVQ